MLMANSTGIAAQSHDRSGRAFSLAPIGVAVEFAIKRKPDYPMGATK